MAVQQKIKHKCPPHHFIIDSENVGHCRYCPAVKDFGRLLEREGVFVAAGRRGAKARKEVLGEKRGRKKKELATTIAEMSASAKERWQDPEYQAKMSGRKRKKPKYG